MGDDAREANCANQVYIVTGSNTGVGKEVANILYSKNAKVYMAARSEDKASKAMGDIKKAWPKSTGSLVFQRLDLADLSTIKASAEQFKEPKLHGLINNAAVQALKAEPPNNVTVQGYEIHMGVNVLGTFLFTKLLTPKLVETAKSEPPNTVRIVWVSSMGLEVVGEKDYGLTPEYLKYWPKLSPLERYGISKAGNWLYAVEFARRYKAEGVVSVPCNPGHLRSDLYRDAGTIFSTLLHTFITYPPIYGAYTELFSALSPKLTMANNAAWGKYRPVYSLSLTFEANARAQSGSLGSYPSFAERSRGCYQARIGGGQRSCQEVLGLVGGAGP